MAQMRNPAEEPARDPVDGGDPSGRSRPGGVEPTEPTQRTGRAEPALDPTAIRAQPALTSSSGAIWLIVGGLFAAVSLAVLIPVATLPGGTVAAVAAIAVGVIYLGMVLARLAIPEGRRRLGVLATGMLLIAGIALSGALVALAGIWEIAVE